VGQGEPPIVILSFQDTSCGAWTKSAGERAVRAQYHYQVGFERMPDSDTLALYIDKFCREKPLQSFTNAAFDLVEELRDKPGRLPTPR